MASNMSDFIIETTTKEYGSLEHVKDCHKNPGHEQFYNIDDLSVDILPDGCKTEQWLSFIQDISKRVVKLTVTKADGTTLYGTGCLYINNDSDRFYIQTNEHVVGSQEDVNNCLIDFFYDTEDRTGIVSSRGIKLVDSDKELDVFDFTFHPVPQTLRKLLLQSEKMFEPQTDFDNVIAISHPHGGPKTITIGKCIKEGLDHGSYICTHTAKTCPGSSGGLVFNLRGNKMSYKLYESNKFIQCTGERRDVYNGKTIETVNINQSVFTIL